MCKRSKQGGKGNVVCFGKNDSNDDSMGLEDKNMINAMNLIQKASKTINP